VYDDARVSIDAEQALDAQTAQDAGHGWPDFGVRDARTNVIDAGPLPQIPFSGVWSVFDQASVLYARQVDAELSLIVGGFPFVYTGTIASDGAFQLLGNTLIRSGCSGARIEGQFDARTSFYTLKHQSCDSNGQAFETNLRGAWQSFYDVRRSGVYRLSATVVLDLSACYTGRTGPYEVIYGFSVDSTTNRFAAFTAQDLITRSMIYLGNYSPSSDSFSSQQTPFTAPGDFDTAFSGQFEQFGTNDPVGFVGQRDVIDPDTQCSFSLRLEGQRIRGP